MNERIKEIYEKCHHRYSEHHINLEKFTELVVLECADIAEKFHLAPSAAVSYQMKKHFGIKE